jgi:hypothetical protein
MQAEDPARQMGDIEPQGILCPVSRALGSGHGFTHLLDDSDERFLVGHPPRFCADESDTSGSIRRIAGMKHTFYEDPITHQFALIRLPGTFAEGDVIPILPTDRWFSSREEARCGATGVDE